MASTIVRLPLYNSFVDFTPVLPNYYWNVYSSEERIKAICLEMCKLIEYANEIGIQTNVNTDDIEALENEFDTFKQHGFESYYEQQIENWINENAEEVITKLIKSVYFGITTTGYFCAYIPESWNDIYFSTGAQYGTQNYGRLILSFDVDSPSSEVIQDPNWLTTIDDTEFIDTGIGG